MMRLLICALWTWILSAGAVSAELSGRFLALDPIAPIQTEMAAHVLHLSFDDGWINLAFARTDQPEKAQCDMNGPCRWDIHPLAIFAEEDAEGRLSVDQMVHQRSRVIVTRADDLADFVTPIVEFLDGAVFTPTDDGAVLTNGKKTIELIHMSYNDAKSALMVSQLAKPNDREIMKCYARQLASLTERSSLSEVEGRMLSVAKIARSMGDLSAQPTFWRNTVPEDERTVRQVMLRTQMMGVIGGMVFAPYDGPETLKALFEAVIADEVIANTLDLDGLRLSHMYVEGNGDAILALRRYAQWLRTIPSSQITERLCKSILPN